MENPDFSSLLKSGNFKVKYDEAFNEDWDDEILLSHIIDLDCSKYNLRSLPNLINCQELNCSYNRLKNLPNLPNCLKLYC